MAYYIKSIPTLTGEVAQRFNERAAEAEANRGSVDFSEQVSIARSILSKAHLEQGLMAASSFLDSECEFWKMTEGLVARCHTYSCSKDEQIDKFFREEFADYDYQMLGKTYCFVTTKEQKIVAAFSVSNSSVRVDDMPKSKRNKLNRKIPFSKQRSQYPAVLVAQLAVFDGFSGLNIGKEVLNFIKSWFIDPLNKTGCRYIVVDAVNNPKVLQFYQENGFEFIFSSDEEEMLYLSKSENITEGDIYRKTRLMVCDLMPLRSDKR